MRVLVITQYFPPETGAAPARAMHFARGLVRAGHEVRVVTGLPNHPSGEIRPEYAGIRRSRERHEGILVERVWLHATPDKTRFNRLLNHLSFAMSALPAAFRGPKPDVVFASIPPPFLGVTAWLAARRFSAPLVLDCRDDWPYAAIAMGELKPGFATGVIDRTVRFLQHRAARVIAVTPSMLKRIEARGLDAGRLSLIANGADTDLFSPGIENGDGERSFTVLYAGTHGLVHGMEVLLDAANALRSRDNVRFLFVGDGVAKVALQEHALTAGLHNVEFRPSLPPQDLVDVIRKADVCVATTRQHSFCGETIPVKLFDYLACGRPVVAAVQGDAAEVVTASGGGIVVEPGNADAMGAAIVGLVNDASRRAELGRHGRAFVEQRYSRRAAAAELERILVDVLQRSRGRAVRPKPGGLYGVLRRVADVLVAGGALLVLSPLLLLVALAVRLDSPGPSLFRQRRIGRGSSEFSILKFRTMHVGTPDLASHLMGPDCTRVTKFGRLLRRTSIDELPQLWNVLTGDMTLVGPRPALFNQDDLIALRQREGIDALKPGVTGWAQIHGRDAMGVERKVSLDRHYLDHASLLFDLDILLRTPLVLFSGRGVF